MEDRENREYEEVTNHTYAGLQLFVRDMNLGWLEERYTVGRVLREKGFSDASERIGGLVTTHRMAILSNQMKDLSDFEQGTNWGLHVANRDSRFQVLDVYRFAGKTQIILLHLPEKGWEVFLQSQATIDRDIVEEVRKRFELEISVQPIPEVTTGQWIERCAFPLGMTDNGDYFDLTDVGGNNPFINEC